MKLPPTKKIRYAAAYLLSKFLDRVLTFLTYDHLPPLPKDIPAEWSYALFKIKEKKKQRIRHYRRKINRRRLL